MYKRQLLIHIPGVPRSYYIQITGFTEIVFITEFDIASFHRIVRIGNTLTGEKRIGDIACLLYTSIPEFVAGVTGVSQHYAAYAPCQPEISACLILTYFLNKIIYLCFIQI